MSSLQKIIYLKREQYETLLSNNNTGQVQSGGVTLTGVQDDNIYFITDETISASDLGNDFILPVSNGGTGKTQFTAGSLLVGNGQNALTEISATDQNTPNTIIKRNGSGNFSAGIITATLNGNANSATSASELANKAVNNTSINNTAGTFSFQGSGNPWNGYDWVGLQVGSANDKFQIVGTINTDSLLYRNNDNGNTNTNWGSWQIIAHAASGGSTVGNSTTPIYMAADGLLTAGTALHDLAYISKPTSENQTTTYLRGDGSWVSLSDMGLSTAMHFIGVATVSITDGGTEDPKIGGNTTTVTAGDVVIDSDSSREYVWSSIGKWELLGGDSSYWVASTDTAAKFWRGDNNWSDTISGGTLKITNNNNTITIGSVNENWGHITNSADIPFYFNHKIHAVDGFSVYNTTTSLTNNNLTFSQGGGWYMNDSTWIRTVGSKNIYQNAGILRTDGTFQVGNNGKYVQFSSSGIKLGDTTAAANGANLITVNGHMVINGTYNSSNSYSEGIRINRSSNGWSVLTLGGTQGTTSAAGKGVWLVGAQATPNDGTTTAANITDSKFYIAYNGSGSAACRITGHNATGFSIRPRVGIGLDPDTDYSLKVAGTSWLQGPVRIGNADTAGTEVGNNGYAVANSGSTNYIAFYGTYNDNPGSFNHTYIGESIYGSTTTANEQSELLLFKGNDISTTNGPDRIRLFAREVDIQVYESNTSGSWDTIRQATGTQVANFKKGEVTVDGNITANTFTGDLAGNADTATLSDEAKKLTDLSTTDNASSTTTWRKIWMSYNDGTTGRPALTENLAYQTSTNTFKSPHFLAQHTAGGSQEFRVTYSTTIDFWMGVDTQNANHGIYDEKKGEWILLAGTNNKWTFAGNADTSTTATNLANAPTIKQGNTVVTDLSENTSYTLNVGGQSVSFKTPIDEKVTQNVLGNTTNKKYGILTSAYETSSTSSTATTVNRDSKVYINPSLNQVAAGQFTVHDKAASPIEKVSLKWNSTDLALEFVFS